MKSKDIVIVGVLLGIGAIVRYVSLVVPGAITSNLVIAFYALAIALILPKFTEAIGIGLVAGIICAMISHSVFPPANLISEPVGALVALGVILGAERITRNTDRKDNIIGYLLVAVSAIALIIFGGLVAFKDLLKINIDAWNTMDPLVKICLGLAFVVAADRRAVPHPEHTSQVQGRRHRPDRYAGQRFHLRDHRRLSHRGGTELS